MPGTIVFKPLSAKLTRNTEFFGKMDPYCRVIVGKQKLDSQVCKNGGKHPHWEDTLVFKRKSEPTCHVELKEKDWLLPDDLIGSCEINLSEVEMQKRVLKWYPCAFKGKPVGQVLLEISYEPDMAGQQVNKVEPPVHRVVEETIVQPPVVPQGQVIEHLPIPPQQNQGWQPAYQQHQHLHRDVSPISPHFQLINPQQQIGGDKYPVLGQEMWAPSYGEGQQDPNYPKIYPQFDQHWNQQGGYHPNK